MRCFSMLGALLALISALAIKSAEAQDAPITIEGGGFKWKLDTSRLPVHERWKHLHNIVEDPLHGNLFVETVFHGPATDDDGPTLVYSADGTKLLKSIGGRELVDGQGPHGLEGFRNIDDELYLYHAHNASKGHPSKIFCTDSAGNLVWRLDGVPDFLNEVYKGGKHNQTDVIVEPNGWYGDFADGYGSQWIYRVDLTTGKPTGLAYNGEEVIKVVDGKTQRTKVEKTLPGAKLTQVHGGTWDGRDVSSEHPYCYANRSSSTIVWFDAEGVPKKVLNTGKGTRPCDVSFYGDFMFVPDIAIAGFQIYDGNNKLIAKVTPPAAVDFLKSMHDLEVRHFQGYEGDLVIGLYNRSPQGGERVGLSYWECIEQPHEK